MSQIAPIYIYQLSLLTAASFASFPKKVHHSLGGTGACFGSSEIALVIGIRELLGILVQLASLLASLSNGSL
jgi:ABC-type Co2+ transport system permease subunit